jgi:hypothetical protein
MATLDDKLLGEKLQNYCSSSEDEGKLASHKCAKAVDSVLFFVNLFESS